MGFQLFLIIGVIVHSCFATGNIYALDSAAIYEGLLAPENIIGTNLQVKKLPLVLLQITAIFLLFFFVRIFSFQNLINFVASVVGWAMLVPLYQPPERVMWKMWNNQFDKSHLNVYGSTILMNQVKILIA